MDFAAINQSYAEEEGKEDFNIEIEEPKPLKSLPKRAEEAPAPEEDALEEEEAGQEDPEPEEEEEEVSLRVDFSYLILIFRYE